MTGSLTYDLSFTEYVAIPAEHFSGLKALEMSPLHYHRAPAKAETEAMRIGRILHALALDPHGTPYAVWDGGRRVGKAWDAFKDEHAGDTILRPEDLQRALDMRQALAEHPIAGVLLADGRGEITVRWHNGEVGCKARVDWLLSDGGLVELKTTRRIRPDAFAREVASRLYHAQIAFYATGLEAALGFAPPRCFLIAAENEAPFDIAVYRVGTDVIDAGAAKVDTWLRTLAQCRASKQWPGVGGNEMIDLRLPEWATAEDLPEVELGGMGDDDGE